MKRLGFALLLGVLLMACGDDYYVPDMKQDYLTAYSSATGELESVLTDEGQLLTVLEDATGSQTTADSLVRVVCNYTELKADDGQVQGIRINAVTRAVSPIPRAADTFEEGVKTDPARVMSIWMGLDYLNCILQVDAQNQAHYFHFVEEAVSTDEAAGLRTVDLLLYHDAGDDLPAYTQRAYLSIPLRHYATEGIREVKVRFRLYVDTDEQKNYEFTYTPD